MKKYLDISVRSECAQPDIVRYVQFVLLNNPTIEKFGKSKSLRLAIFINVNWYSTALNANYIFHRYVAFLLTVIVDLIYGDAT
ncbi:hypothetical protein PCURB6_41160 [Paenibacillus curdlanolyticus]|nr:hypothetical protein PCURB6_41160 [Paenibacillus curdlanolyticus]